MSIKKLLLPKSNSEFSIDTEGSFRSKASLKSFILQTRRNTIPKKPEVRIVKAAKENAVSYEEFLDILQKPHIFIIKWSSTTGCCRKKKFSHFEIESLSGTTLLKGKYRSSSVCVVDSRSRLFMILTFANNGEGEATLSVPNSSIPLATIKKLPSYIPYNRHYQMVSEHFPELSFNIEQQTLPGRYSGSLFKYTITQGRRIVGKLLQPAKGDQMYVLVDESVSVFQKSGLLAASIFVSQKPQQNLSKMVIISLIFTVVFIFGFVVVASTVFDLRYKNPDYDGTKFPNKLKSTEDVP